MTGSHAVTVVLLLTISGYARSQDQDSRARNRQGQNQYEKRVEKLLDTSPTVDRARFGYQFRDVQTGEVLAQRDETSFFTPASNAKLYTTAAALARLGESYQFRTELRTSGNWAPGQSALLDLELIGGGDPNLSGRVLPYTFDSKPGDCFAALEELADKVAAKGIREVNGDVTRVATRYPGDLLPDGWTSDDSIYGYGAAVSALTFNDNTVTLSLAPTDIGDLAEVGTSPATNYFTVLNEVITDAGQATHIHITRPPGSTEVIVWGTIGKRASPWQQDLGVEDPAKFAAQALISVLRDRGIVVRGVPRTRYRDLTEVANPLAQSQSRPAEGITLAVHESGPLSQALQVVNKVSQNLHAEMLLREIGRVTHGVGTLEAGVKERETFLQEIGVTRDGTGYVLADGSGLARQDLVTPDSTVRLLRAMWQIPDREVWLRTLPIGGVDGSLQHRFRGTEGAERVHAKTGSLSHVDTLSGYLQTQQGRWLAFSIMVNGAVGRDKDVRDFIDRVCGLFLPD